ncbi:MAG: EAL domain-containing protein [Christensenellaceae bacterium]|jgi:lactose/cellobiose-specific phosphotransferase system IIC component|nr:EAL domain-containing protein [Christensenellaceae bacterium]
MSNFTTKLSNRLLSGYIRLENGKFISCLRKGFISIVPIFLIGAFSLAIINFPIATVKNFIGSALDGYLYKVLRFIYESTFGLASVFLIMSVSYRYSITMVTEDRSKTYPIMSMLVSLASYFAILGLSIDGQAKGSDISIMDFNFTINLGVHSILVALIVAALATKLFISICLLFERKNYIKYTSGQDVGFYSAIICLIPMLLTILVFTLFSILISIAFNGIGIVELLTNMFEGPIKKIGSNSYGAGLLILFLQTIFWFFGLHGGNAFDSIILDMFPDKAGQIITKTIFDNFVLIGGCGASLGLIIAIIIFSKNKGSRYVAKGATVPMIFNINETLIFGLPVVLNPVFLLPFIFAPLVNFTIAYLSSLIGLVSLQSGDSMPWTTPILFSGFMITNSLSGLFLQLVIIIVDIFIYMPFVKLNDNLIKLRTTRAIQVLQDKVVHANERDDEIRLLEGDSELSEIARRLLQELRIAVKKDKVDVYYQPQIDVSGRAVSCEALLRWKFDENKFIAPQLILALAKEDNFYETLNDYLINKVLNHAVLMNKEFNSDFKVSINIAATHFMNIKFIRNFVDQVNALKIRPYTININVVDQDKLQENDDAPDIFALLKRNHIHVEIGDFNMKHTTLLYIRNHSFLYVRLDPQLVKKLLVSSRMRDIVKSIVQLGNQLGFNVIAEYVETEEQRNLLTELGCHIFQGWLYSPAIPINQLVDYVSKRNSKDFNYGDEDLSKTSDFKEVANLNLQGYTSDSCSCSFIVFKWKLIKAMKIVSIKIKTTLFRLSLISARSKRK